MDINKFCQLTQKERDTLFIAMHVRNNMEDFHCANLTDDLMKELNQIIRKAIIQAMIIEDKSLYSDNKEEDEWMSVAFFNIKMIPDYWEIPEEKKIEKELSIKYRRKNLDEKTDS